MKRKLVILILAVATLTLTACGRADHKEGLTVASESVTKESESVPEIQESQEIAPEQTIVEYRDELELEQLMSYSSERQQELSAIMVDLAEESEKVRNMASSVLEPMKNGYSAAALQIVESADWKETLFPSLVIGQRNYYLKVSEQENIRYMVAADEVGNSCTAILYSGENGHYVYLEKSDEQLKFVEYFQANGVYSSENLRFADGTYMKYDGMLDSENYVLVGDVKISIGTVSMSDGILQAWNVRGNALTEYTGTFNETGRTTIVTPNSLKNEGKLAYATHSQRRGADYLATQTELSADDYSFYGDFVGLYTVWGRLQ